MQDDHPSRSIERRSFLKGSAATLGLGALAIPGARAETATIAERIQRYAPLGRTNLRISDISYGSSRTDDPAIVRHAFERGINYFDSAESYKGGNSETSIGKALSDVRDRVILTSKVKCGTSTRKAELMAALENSLRRLRTDRIDVYFNHAVNQVERLDNPEWYEFSEQAKKQGKIRFTGMSGHAGRLVECLDHAVDEGLVDVVLVGYNFGQDPAFYQRFMSRIDWVAVQSDLPRVLSKAHQKGIGVVAMKTLRGARLNDMRPFEHGGATYAQAAFRWTLSNPSVDALIVSMTSRELVDEYVGASGAPAPKGAELDLLDDYLLGDAEGYCEHGCEACHGACPAGVEINEVLRTRMYAIDYGDHEYARTDYSRLEAGAAACTSCSAKPCLGRCPSGIEVGQLTASTHRMLG